MTPDEADGMGVAQALHAVVDVIAQDPALATASEVSFSFDASGDVTVSIDGKQSLVPASVLGGSRDSEPPPPPH